MEKDIIRRCLSAGPINAIILRMWAEYEQGNFGDLLSRYIVEKLSGRKIIKYTENNTYHLSAVGSLLTPKEMCAKTVVWGSGFLFRPSSWHKIVLTKIKQGLRGKTGRPVYLAVRGAKTREILLNAGYECPAVYADPALLLPHFYSPAVSKKFKVGVVLHWKQEKFIPLFSQIEGVKIIKIHRRYDQIHNFVDEELQCEHILSSSLHGLIVANAYKIPCVRLKITDHPIADKEEQDDFKFEDYLSGLNGCKEDKKSADYSFNTLLLPPDVPPAAALTAQVAAQATRPEFTADLTPLVQAFPFLLDAYKNKEFKI